MASSETAFEFPLAQGLHARPASLLAAAAARFAADVVLVHEARAASADAKSPLALIGLDVRHGDACRLVAVGRDAAEAVAALRDVLGTLPACEEPEAGARPAGEVVLPRTLRAEGLRWYPGSVAAPGVGRGAVVRVTAATLPDALSRAADEPTGAHREPSSGAPPVLEDEGRRVRRALETVRAALEPDPAAPPGPATALRAAHRALLGDPALERLILERVRAGEPAGPAVVRAIGSFTARLRRSTSRCLRERAVDLDDLGCQLLEAIHGAPLAGAVPALLWPSVVVADTLAPRQVLALDRDLLRGIVLEHGGTTSHALILARSFGIPAVSGVAYARALVPEGAEVIVDAELGAVIVSPDARVLRHYERRERAGRGRRERLVRAARAPAVTRDGWPLRVKANVSSAAEVGPAIAAGAEGIGLFRTEMLFMDRDTPPGEDEQFAVYAAAVQAADGREVVIRALDAGGDKPIPYLRLPREANPFLGVRGVRLYRSHPELLRVQLRAILRASARGPTCLMAPMVSDVEEVRWFRARLNEVRVELAADGVAFDPRMPVGIMLEVPAAAQAIGLFAPEVDFFSIGTNDLAQYFFAADRGNPAVSGLRDERRPVFLRLLHGMVKAAGRRARPVSLCGEMAADPANVPLLVGLGLAEISLAARRIPEVKHAIARASLQDCRGLLARAKDCGTPAEVERLLGPPFTASAARGSGLLDRELVVFDSDAETREEVVEDAVAALVAAGRTDRPREVEEAVWAREAAYSTGLGHGFAVPHAKTDAVTASSIVMLRCARPVPWDAADGAPVRFVVLLVVRASGPSDTHLRTLARLARLLMDDDFRHRLMTAPHEDYATRLLADSLEAPSAPA